MPELSAKIVSDAISDRFAHLSDTELAQLAQAAERLLDVSATATGRATFYQNQQEQQAAEAQAHQHLFALDRGFYGLLLVLPGGLDRARQQAILRLLQHPRPSDQAGLLSATEEQRLIQWLNNALPVTRRLKLLAELAQRRVNNARTRKLQLQAVLQTDSLEFWAVRYRRKLAKILTHALGKRHVSILRTILAKAPQARTTKEQALIAAWLGYPSDSDQFEQLAECVSFILGNEQHLSLPLLNAYHAAKRQLKAGHSLPYETLEGLRSCYHPQMSPTAVLQLTAKQLTKGQKRVLQRKAEQRQVKVAFDPAQYDTVQLYLYAFERGLSDAIQASLAQKAQQAAKQLPWHFERIAIVLDASASLVGDQTQALRPFAVSLAVRDTLLAASEQSEVITVGGQIQQKLLRPQGATALAPALVAALRTQPDAVFLLTDGYENAPAGRVAEVMRCVRTLGISTPVYQLTPVFAAESGGVRSLSPETIPALPVAKAEGLGLSLLRLMLRYEPRQALTGLAALALPRCLPKEAS